MFEHSYYWIGYGVFFFITGLTMIAAMYARQKSEGTPFNYRLLAVNWGTCWAMWTGVAITEYLYHPGAMTLAALQFTLGAWVVGGIAWWMKRDLIKNFLTPKAV